MFVCLCVDKKGLRKKLEKSSLAVFSMFWFLNKSETQTSRIICGMDSFSSSILLYNVPFFLKGSICGNKSLPAWSIGAIVLTFPGAICQAWFACRLFGPTQLLPNSEGGKRDAEKHRWIDQLQTSQNETLYWHITNNDQTRVILVWLGQRSLFLNHWNCN